MNKNDLEKNILSEIGCNKEKLLILILAELKRLNKLNIQIISEITYVESGLSDLAVNLSTILDKYK